MRATRSNARTHRRDAAVLLIAAVTGGAAIVLLPQWIDAIPLVVSVAAAGLLLDRARRLIADAQEVGRLRHENQTLRQAALAAQLAKQADGEFVAHVSHEIRTPMTSILGFTEVLLEPDSTRSERRVALLAIQRNARHLSELVNEVLDLSKIKAERMPVARVQCDLPELIAEAVGLTRPAALQKGLQFKVTLDTPVPRRVETDPLRVRQILVNLIANATRFTEEGTIELRVGCRRADASGEQCILHFDVVDTGIGMTAEQLGQIFRPFAQADDSVARRFGGTGLGLTIAKSLANLLGGDVAVRSEPGAGSTFTLEIKAGQTAGVPMLERLELPQLTANETAPVPSTTCGFRLNGRILLADDAADNQRLIARHLRRAGATVTIVGTGRAAVERLAAERFDVVLMDLRMPDLDGCAALACIRAAGDATPVIALTANAATCDRDKCLAAGFDGYLTKPIEKEKLLANVAGYLVRTAVTGVEAAAPSAADLPMTSLLADEPDLSDLLAEFVRMLPQKVRELHDRLARNDTAGLRELAHQIKGAAGGYGFPRLSACAGKLEGQLHSGASADTIRRTINVLVALVRNVDGYPLDAEHAPRDVA